MARSRAGIFLAMAALTGIVMMVRRENGAQHADGDPRLQRRTRRISLAVAHLRCGFCAAGRFGWPRERFESNIADDLRIPLA